MPQLGFLTPRQDADHLSLNYKDMESRKVNEKKALRAVKFYTEQSAKCRMLLIQDYFDESTSKTCGICDVCMKLKKLGLNTEATNILTDKIIRLLPCTAATIELQLSNENKEAMAQIIKFHFENGLLSVDSQGLIFKR
jgi:ATP-dependent DNA helicase RecQ